MIIHSLCTADANGTDLLPGALGAVDQGLAHLADLEDGGGLDVIPVLAGEGIDDLLLGTLLATDLQTLKDKTAKG